MESILSTKELAEKTRVSVAHIKCDDGKSGTGIIYSEYGLALTNEHVIRGAKNFWVTATNVAGKEQTLPAEVLGTDPDIDLAVIRFEGGPYLAARLGSAENIGLGEEVVALGYPLSPNLAVTDGVVSNIYNDGIRKLIRHTASINPGNSGGPLFTRDGLVIGINTEILRYLPNPQPGAESDSNPFYLIEGFNMAVAIDEATSRIKRLETGTVVPNPAEYWSYLIYRGDHHSEKGQYESAIQEYTEAIRLNPGAYVAYTNRGNSYFALGQYEAAIQDYDAAISRINPRVFETAADNADLAADLVCSVTYGYKGTAYYYLGQYKDALRTYNRAIKLSGIFSSHYNGRGNAYNGLGQYERAIRDYNKAIKLDGQTGIYYYNRSNAYAKASALDEAKAKELGYKP